MDRAAELQCSVLRSEHACMQKCMQKCKKRNSCDCKRRRTQLKLLTRSHQEEIWGDELVPELLGSEANIVELIQPVRPLLACECLQIGTWLHHLPLDARHHLPDADLLQMLDACVNRRRGSLDLILCDWAGFFKQYRSWNLFSTLANDSFNPAPASSLSFFLFTHSFTVYCIHVLLFCLSSTEFPQVLLAVQGFVLVKAAVDNFALLVLRCSYQHL